jgi:hypothetical protein
MLGQVTSSTIVSNIIGVLVIATDENGMPKLMYTGQAASAPEHIAGHAAVGLPITASAPQPVMAVLPDAATPTQRKKRRTKAEMEAARAAQATTTTPQAAAVTPPVAAPAVQQATPEVTQKKRGRPAGSKNKTTETTTTTTPQQQAAKKPQHRMKVWMPLNEACGLAIYKSSKGSFPVAIWDVSSSAKTGVAYKLAFITKEVRDDGKGGQIKFAYHEQGDWAIDSKSEKLSNVQMY